MVIIGRVLLLVMVYEPRKLDTLCTDCIPLFVLKHTPRLLQVITVDYQGCLRDVHILTSTSPTEVWTPLDWDSFTEQQGALANREGCPNDLETAYHFLGTSTSLKLTCQLGEHVLRNITEV